MKPLKKTFSSSQDFSNRQANTSNLAEGIQLFTQNGDFYREVRFGGPQGTQSTPAWLPFRPPSATALATVPSPDSPEIMQLQRLVARLGEDDTFMRSFWLMIQKATNNMQAAPEAYAGFTNAALVGRPLALTQAGWSLELATDELVSQAAKDNTVERKLLAGKKEDYDKEDEDSDAENSNPSQYAFKIMIGDTDKGFDGLVGVFNCDKSLDPKTRTDLGLVLDTIYSDYLPEGGSPKDKNGRKVIAPTRPLVLRPFYPSPTTSSNAAVFAEERNRHLSVRAVLIDPFSPIHAYSGLFPVHELVLPPWTWQTALSRMKAFFHSGPLLITRDVPSEFERDRELTPEKPVIKVPDIKPGEPAVAIPGLGKEEWAWLQPYYPDNDEKVSSEVAKEDLKEPLERYMVLPTGMEDERARFEEGPYSMIEGYLLRVGGEKEKTK